MTAGVDSAAIAELESELMIRIVGSDDDAAVNDAVAALERDHASPRSIEGDDRKLARAHLMPIISPNSRVKDNALIRAAAQLLKDNPDQTSRRTPSELTVVIVRDNGRVRPEEIEVQHD